MRGQTWSPFETDASTNETACLRARQAADERELRPQRIPASDELEPEELEPEPPDELLDDRDEELDEDEPVDDELDDEEVELLLELELDELEEGALDELDAGCPPGFADAPSDELPVGSVGDSPQAVLNMPTPASARPPESTLRNSRRSSRRAAASTALTFDCSIPSTSSPGGEQVTCHGGTATRQAAGGSGGSAPPS